jgi:FixJ family two-component response regulator
VFRCPYPWEAPGFRAGVSGKFNQEIAFSLGAPEKTIKANRPDLMRKLKCRSIAALPRLALELHVT